MRFIPSQQMRLFLTGALILSLGACSSTRERLTTIGTPPPMSSSVVNTPSQVSMPMPEQVHYEAQPNSLWQTGSRAFFKDQRATKIGDILTVTINITDSAALDNSTSRSRTAREGAAANALLGYEQSLDKVLPEAIDPSALIDADSRSNTTGTGKVERKEDISTTVAAVITQILPNGNLVIQGKQEVRLNFEMREVLVSGVVRPEDISNQNTIRHTQIAEARISYGGRGQITDVQQPRYGQQIADIVLPY